MTIQDLDEQAFRGVCEAIASHTVVIDVSLVSKQKPDWGTGSLIKINDKFFILSCKHVVKPEYEIDNLRFLYRNIETFQFVEKEVIKKIHPYLIYPNLHKTFPQKLPIIDRIYSDNEDDLVLLEIDSSSEEIKEYNFFEITGRGVKTPEGKTEIYYMGFSRELTVKASMYGDIAVFGFFGWSFTIEKNINTEYFNPIKHFLIEFKITNDFNIDPYGLSGCGVWSRKPSGKDKLWTPNVYLIGVQQSYFKESQVLKATRIERLIELAK